MVRSFLIVSCALLALCNADSRWIAYGGDYQRTGYVKGEQKAGSSLNVKWSYNAPAGVSLVGNPLVINSRVHTLTSDGKMVVLDAASGNVKASQAIGGTVEPREQAVVPGLNTLLVTQVSKGPDGRGVKAFDEATLAAKWDASQYPGKTADEPSLLNTLVVSESLGNVYYASKSNKVIAYESASGNVAFNTTVRSMTTYIMGMSLHNDQTLVVAQKKKFLNTVDAKTGAIISQVDIDADNWLETWTPVISGDLALVLYQPDVDHFVVKAFKLPSLEVAWKTDGNCKPYVTKGKPGLAIDGVNAYVPCYGDNQLVAYKLSDGTKAMAYTFMQNFDEPRGHPIVTDSHLIAIGTRSVRVYDKKNSQVALQLDWNANVPAPNTFAFSDGAIIGVSQNKVFSLSF